MYINVEALDHLKVQQRDRDQSSSTEAYQQASQPNVNLDFIKWCLFFDTLCIAMSLAHYLFSIIYKVSWFICWAYANVIFQIQATALSES